MPLRDDDIERRLRALERRAPDERVPLWQRDLRVNKADFPVPPESGGALNTVLDTVDKLMLFHSTGESVQFRSAPALLDFVAFRSSFA